MVLRTALLLLYAAASAAGPDAMAPPTMAPPTMAHTDLMSAGPESPWAGFRIPGFAAVRGHLFAFAEARQHTCADFGHHDLVMRRSVDDGASWEPLRVLMNPDEVFDDCNATEAMPCTAAEQANCQTGHGRQCGGGCAVWDPMPVVDNRSGTIHLFFGRSTSSCKGTKTTGRRGPTDKADLWVMTSTDLGLSFGSPVNLTVNCSFPYGHGAIGTALHGWVPSGGHGIQLSTGELLAPIYNNAGQGLCISEDFGRSWHAGGWLHGGASPGAWGPFSGPFEGEVVELFGKTPSGKPRLLYDCRIKVDSEHGCGAVVAGGRNVSNCRITYVSENLGKTWSVGRLHPEMADPSCKGGIVRQPSRRAGGGGGVLFAVGADNESERIHDSIWASVDDGASFPHKLRVDSSGGYSTVQMTESGLVASVYEDAGGAWNSSVAAAGGCHVRIAMVDPALILPTIRPK